jgi:hypothetical protein
VIVNRLNPLAVMSGSGMVRACVSGSGF